MLAKARILAMFGLRLALFFRRFFRLIQTMVSRLTFLILSVALLSGCYEVPVTGRHSVSLVDKKGVAKMSIAAFEEMKTHYPVSRDRQLNEQLRRVGERLAKVVFWDMPDAEWEFVVFDVPQQINAFAMAGGKVGVFTGLYKITENDDQLASVLAHEISHVTAEHVSERLSQQMAVSAVGVVGAIGMLGVGADPLLGSVVLDAYGLGTTGVGAAFDRKKEKEADFIGLHYMARAGYDPQEAVKVLEKLENFLAGAPVPPAFLATHPSNPERILQLMDEMPKALKEYEDSGHKVAPILIK
ncbi:MAG: M48 family peptidase [Opitutaceae bacterium]|nr:M48 family peptidase [Opitutaceae bacterium]